MLQAIILGIVQGLTEFFPVSSSGHLVLAENLMQGFPKQGILFETLVHLGTLVAVLVYFRKELSGIIRGFGPSRIKSGDEESRLYRRLCYLLLLGTVPAGLVGVVFKDRIEGLFDRPMLVCFALLATGLFLFFIERIPDGNRSLTGVRLVDAILIGCSQALAIMPGISRSGATLATAVFLGVNRRDAARFSFLLSIPAIGGAFVLQLGDFLSVYREATGQLTIYLAGAAAAAIVGYASIHIMIWAAVSRNLRGFAYYCWSVGILGIIFIS